MVQRNYLKISQLARESGVPRSTIHYYLKVGLLHPPIKTGQTMAYYDDSHLRRLQEINRMKTEQRLPIVVIKNRLRLAEESERMEPSASVKPVQSNENDIDTDTERRKRLIETGIEVFADHGYRSTRVQDITERLGISTGTFYHCFAHKRELFVAVVNYIVNQILQQSQIAVEKENTFGQRLFRRAESYFDSFKQFRSILSQLKTEAFSGEDWSREKLKITYRQLTLPVIRDYDASAADEGLKTVDPDQLAFAVVGLVEIYSLREAMDRKVTRERFQDFFKSLILAGLLGERSLDVS